MAVPVLLPAVVLLVLLGAGYLAVRIVQRIDGEDEAELPVQLQTELPAPPPARRRSEVVERFVRAQVVVTLKSGAAFQGVLFDADERGWVLREAVALGAADHGQNVPVDGEILVLTGDILYAQRP